MIGYYFEPCGDTVMIVVKDPEKGLTYSRTPIADWYKHITYNPRGIHKNFLDTINEEELDLWDWRFLRHPEPLTPRCTD